MLKADYLRPNNTAVAITYTYVPYQHTGYFSDLVNAYLDALPETDEWYSYAPNSTGIDEAIAARQSFPADRSALTAVLARQYATLPVQDKVTENISLLASDNTYTICTAHQPNLLTGYLYFTYKILHAIKLAEELTALHPGKRFVPVYYMGSEDNDIEELGAFRFRGDKFVWDGSGQQGAVGRMDTAGLKPILLDLFKRFGPPGKSCEELETIITTAYLKHKTIAAATQYLVHAIFGRYGLVVLNPDEAALKRSFIPVMRDELLHQRTEPIVRKQVAEMEQNYKIQAQPRNINLFYLADGLRERIEKHGNQWIVLNTTIVWDEAAMLHELETHPERFSPNVMLRGLYQETILPNVVFIGGGAEVAYWLQLRTLFQHYGVFYPVIQLRQSVLFVSQAYSRLRRDLDITTGSMFKKTDALVRYYIEANATTDWNTHKEAAALTELLKQVEQKAIMVDATLGPATGAALAKMKYQLDVLEKKMLRAEKRKMAVQVDRVKRLKDALFPGDGLQERIENIMEYYLDYGPAHLDAILHGIRALDPGFLVVEDQD